MGRCDFLHSFQLLNTALSLFGFGGFGLKAPNKVFNFGSALAVFRRLAVAVPVVLPSAARRKSSSRYRYSAFSDQNEQ